MEDYRLHIDHWHQWALPSHGLKIETIDAHVCGQPLRLILDGVPTAQGKTVLEKAGHMLHHMDHLRGALLLEPRGHSDMYAAMLGEPQRHDSHYSVLFLYSGGICPMSGHGIIAVATLCLEAQLAEMKSPETLLRFDTPAGLVRAYAAVENNRVQKVFFENVPSFVLATGLHVNLPEVGPIAFDVAYGGEFYAYVDAASMGLDLTASQLPQISRLGKALSQTILQSFEFIHPTAPALSTLAGVVFCGKPTRRRTDQADAKLLCVFTDGSMDRSPSGTGLSGLLALKFARQELELGDAIVAEGILGGHFTGKVARDGLKVGEYDAIVAEIEGSAYLTGRHCFFVSAEDPLREGFSV